MDCCEHVGQESRHPIPADGSAYTCPMHPEVVRDQPGMCPECGMNLVPGGKKSAHSHDPHGHDAHEEHNRHEGHSTAMFLRKFWVSAVLSIPVVLYSSILHTLFGFTAPAFPGSVYVPPVLASIVFFSGGLVFLGSAWRELRGRAPGMMTLIALAISVAYAWSVYAVFAGAEPLFWELSTLIVIMLLGHWIEMRAVSGAQGALKELSKLLPDTAEVVRNGASTVVPLSELKERDIVIVKPGGKIPADGSVVDGESDVDESMVTGESKPVLKKKGDSVIAGTINGDGSLRIMVAHVGNKTFLAGVMRLVAQAQASKSKLQVLSDRAAFFLTIAAVLAGIITFGAWFALGAGVAFAVARVVAVLVIACPHALGLAVPLVASISTTKAAQNGFLVKQRLALEVARVVDTVLFDKTGTLTEGKFAVTRASSDEALALAASVEALSEHPIAQAVVEEATKRSLALASVSDFKRIPGRGAEGMVGGAHVFVGSKGGNDIVVEKDGKPIGMIAVSDTPRPESKEAVRALKAMGVRTAMVTGDSEEVARTVARELGVDEYFARVLPGDKAKKVTALQAAGRKVAMVGDGVNDAPALAQADLGIAIGAGTNVAIESAGIILVRNDPRDIAKVIRLSKLTYSKMIQNLWWAAGYNILAIPAAAGAFAAWGIFLEPAFAAILMSASTVIVSINAALLMRRKLA